MAIIDIFVFLAGFGAGGALVWFYKSYIQAGVVTVNADVKAVKAVVTDVKAKL